MEYVVCKENFERTVYQVDIYSNNVVKLADIKFIKNNKYKVSNFEEYKSIKLIKILCEDINGNEVLVGFSRYEKVSGFEYYKDFFYDYEKTLYKNVKNTLDEIPIVILEKYLRQKKIENLNKIIK